MDHRQGKTEGDSFIQKMIGRYIVSDPRICHGGIGDVRSYRLDIRTRAWLQPGSMLPSTLRRMIETWVEAHEEELLEQWNKGRKGQHISIVG